MKGKKAEAALGRVCAQDVVDEATGEILLEANDEIIAEKVEVLKKCGPRRRSTCSSSRMQDEADIVRNTLRKDPTHTQEEALHRIYNLLRPGEPPRADSRARDPEQAVLQSQALRPGARRPLQAEPEAAARIPAAGARRAQASWRSGMPDLNHTTLCREDFIVIIKYLLLLRTERRVVTDRGAEPAITDDIDHLGNRRVRSVGELLANQFNIGLARMARIIRERMSLQDAGPGHAVPTWSTRAPSRP